MSKKTRAEELQEDLQDEFNRWEHLKIHGGSDPFYEDGISMNLVRNHIIYDKRKCEEELAEGEYPEAYFRETPPRVDNAYMAGMDEIKRQAQEAIQRYKADGNYRFILRHIGKLDAGQRGQCHVGVVMGYVAGLQGFIDRNDYVGMRRHRNQEVYLKGFAVCRKNVETCLGKMPGEKVLPVGQLALSDLFDMGGGLDNNRW